MARILLLEDDAGFAEVVQMGLTDAGHDLTVAKTGSEAVAHLMASEFDVLITDIFVKSNGRPVPDGGLLLIGRVRNAIFGSELWNARDIPIISVSGAAKLSGIQDVLGMSLSVGANVALAKPFSQNKLLDAIDTLLSKK